MRRPTSTLVVDTSVIISALLSGSARAFVRLQPAFRLCASERTVIEAHRRVRLGMKREDLLPALSGLLEEMEIVTTDKAEPEIGPAELSLRLAVQSRNGSIRDAHILALAWILDADIWSTDRDFAGTGVASWSTANLLRAFAAHA